MKENEAKLETSIQNNGFSTLLLTFLGFVLLEASVLQFGGKPIAHVIVLSTGAIVVSLIYRAIASYYTIAAARSNGATRGHGKLPGVAGMACAALLVIFGYTGATALSSGSMTLFAAFAGCAGIFPWSKIALCRSYILAPLALITAGTVLGLLIVDLLPHAVLFLVAVWMLWMTAVWAWLVNIFYRHRKSKASKRAAHHYGEEPG